MEFEWIASVGNYDNNLHLSRWRKSSRVRVTLQDPGRYIKLIEAKLAAETMAKTRRDTAEDATIYVINLDVWVCVCVNLLPTIYH